MGLFWLRIELGLRVWSCLIKVLFCCFAKFCFNIRFSILRDYCVTDSAHSADLSPINTLHYTSVYYSIIKFVLPLPIRFRRIKLKKEELKLTFAKLITLSLSFLMDIIYSVLQEVISKNNNAVFLDRYYIFSITTGYVLRISLPPKHVFNFSFWYGFIQEYGKSQFDLSSLKVLWKCTMG